MESLEGRALLTTFTWNHAVNGSFSDPTMWVDSQSHHGVPGPGDAAVAPAGNYTITSSGPATVGSFTGGAFLDVTGGTFTVTNAAAGASSSLASLTVAAGAAFHAGGGNTVLNGGLVAGDVDAAAGSTIALNGTTLVFAGSTLTGAGTFSVAASLDIKASITAPKLLVVTQAGNIVVEGTSSLTVPAGATVDWQGGSMAGSIVVARGGTLTIEGPTLKFLNFGVLSIAGSASWTGTGDIFLSGGAALVNQQGGSFNVMNGAQIAGGANGSFINSGTLEKFGNTGISTITVPLTNNGAILLDSQGILHAFGGFTQTSTGLLNTTVAGAPATGQFGQFQAIGVAHLAGTLGVTLGTIPVGGQYIPAIGQVYPVFTYGSAVGNFSNTAIAPVNGIPAFATAPKPTEYDLVARPAPTLTLYQADDTSGPNATVLTQPRLTGKTQPNLPVQVYDQSQKLVAVATADSTGTFIAKLLAPLAVGPHTFFAVAINANQYGFNSLPYSLTVVARPAAPTNLALYQADTSGPNATVLTQPRLTGKAQAGYAVQVYDQATQKLVAVATADRITGIFVAKTLAPLSVGPHTFFAVAIDPFNNYGTNSPGYTFNVVARPAAPTNLALYQADTSGPNATVLTQPRLTGKAQAGYAVQVYDQATQKLVAVATADRITGIFVAKTLAPLSVGPHTFFAVAIDPFSNYGPNGSPFTLTIV